MEKYFKIEKPKIENIDLKEIVHSIIDSDEALDKAISKTENPKYLYWTEFKNKNWFPKSFSQEKIWAIVKYQRKFNTNRTVIRTEDGEYFRWKKLSWYEEMFHHIDLELGGNLMGLRNISKDDKQLFISRGVMEEAIASSQIEGAHITRKLAQKLLREGRKPVDTSERMVVNNYKAMKAIEENFKNEVLSESLLKEIHKIVTQNTLKDGIQSGILRKDSDNIIVTHPNNSLLITHTPPKMKFVKQELKKLVSFANDELNEPYMHPVIKAIMLHFWIGYLHPYGDGNGRLARALFYWYLLRKDYWAFTYFPLSPLIKKSKTQYCMSYVYGEQDEYDLTYFIDYNLRQIKKSKEEFLSYMQKKAQENRSMATLSKNNHGLNDRQIRLLQHLNGNFNDRTNMQSHMSIYGVTNKTAATDLKHLVEQNFLIKRKQGRNTFYYPTEKVRELF